ncbi:MAG: hypothetical protein AAF358_13730 [Pseudomonadota bacterium]
MAQAKHIRLFRATFRHHGEDYPYRFQNGQERTVRAVVRFGHQVIDSDNNVVADSADVVYLQKSEVPKPSQGDRIIIDGDGYVLGQRLDQTGFYGAYLIQND